ncbi:MAG: MFS transporter, partial [Candidatus Amesbacteria bacterium]|nr:MFS transporter [Candidatus Amesbacteria bacterium]
MLIKLPKMSNTTLMVAVTFFANLYFYNHVGTLYLQTRGLTLLQVSSIWSIIMAASLMAEIPTGLIADKIGRKWSIVIALFVQTMGEFLYLFANSYLSFVLIAILAGIGYAFSSGASEALVYDSLPKKNRGMLMQKAVVRIGNSYQVAFFIAPIIGGLIISQLAIDKFLMAILLTAVSVLIAFLFS